MRRVVLRTIVTALLAFTGGTVNAGSATAAPASATEAPGSAIAVPASAPETASKPGSFPEVIALPNGFQPEGIATGRGTSFYVGSLVDGAIYRGDLRTGTGAVFVGGSTGSAATGLKVDRRNRLFVSGAATGSARVYDAGSGALLASYQFVPTGTPTFINDVVVTRTAAYFTDSVNPVLYRVGIGRSGKLAADFTTVPLTGALVYDPTGFNVNGIDASPDGRTLLVVQSVTGLLFAVNSRTGVTTQVDLHGVSLVNGDGLLRRGSTLYVVQNQLNQIAEISLNRSYTSGRLIDLITNPNFQVPTTIAGFGRSLYAVNARFGTPPTPDTTYSVVRVAGC